MSSEDLAKLDVETVMEVLIEELLLEDYDSAVELLLSLHQKIIDTPTRH